MGRAMVGGWLKQPELGRIDIIDPHAPNDLNDKRVRVFGDGQGWSADRLPVDVIVLAVKPQSMTSVAATLPDLVDKETPVLSIAAGITLTNLARTWGNHRPIVRAMPNTPGSIGAGITGYIKNDKVNEKQNDIINTLLSALGLVIEVTDEKQIDAITAISGSGPAYVYNFIEALEKSAINLGLPENVARILARQTVIGSAALLQTSPDSPADLRIAVTSPNGTTEAALKVLMGNHGLEPLLGEATHAAYARSIELAQD